MACAVGVAVALTGMPGAGKSDLAAALRDASGAAIGHLSGVIQRELAAHGDADTPENYARAAARLRGSEGEGVLVRSALHAVMQAAGPRSAILDSLRTEEEYREAGRSCDRLLLVAVHADRNRRFARMRARSGPELQAESDLLQQDLENLRLGVGTLMALADIMVVNTYEVWQPLDEKVPDLLAFLNGTPL